MEANPFGQINKMSDERGYFYAKIRGIWYDRNIIMKNEDMRKYVEFTGKF
jgi:hypothetical protein